MKLVAAVLSAFLIVAFSAPADAQDQGKQKRQAATQAKSVRVARKPPAPKSDYIERLADKLPFGSSAWWEQMLREDRLTCCR